MNTDDKHSSSFRDPGGFLFFRDKQLYRQINTSYKQHYDFLISSGLYEKLVSKNLLIAHKEVEIQTGLDDAYKVIKPEPVVFISYPYEWCFSQLQDAALCTLKIQSIAFKHGMSLKDASAYNIQFKNGKPILIDTLSFEKINEGEPWVAYKQYCQHFLAPLALMCYSDVRLNQLSRIFIDGVPLDLASSLLPFRTKLKLSLLLHIHIHAKSQKIFADKTDVKKTRKMGSAAMLGLLQNLKSGTKKLSWKPVGTEWVDYYPKKINYSESSHQRKKQLVATLLNKTNPDIVWDIGANTGMFSRVASDQGITTISFDIDSGAVERNYAECVFKQEENILPLVLDLTNPSPGIGWANNERESCTERGPADTVLALALIHHLAISNNLPFDRIAKYLTSICKNALIIEFVPKSDTQVKKLLSTRKDIFPDYTHKGFEEAFSKYFTINDAVKIEDTERTIYLMLKNQ